MAFGRAKNSAKSRKLDFKLSFEEFMLIVLAPCYLCGKEKSNRTSYSNHIRKVDNSPTFRHNGIDRVNSKRGYVKGNVKSCCGRCNRMKSDMSLKGFKWQIKRVARYISKRSLRPKLKL